MRNGIHPPICKKTIFFDEHRATLSEWVHNGSLSDEFAFYVTNGFKPTHWLEIPDGQDSVWNKGNPAHVDGVLDKQVLTLSSFYPSGKLGAALEVKSSSPIGMYPNHPAFEGAKFWLLVEDLRDQAKPMPVPHELRHGKVDQLDDFKIGDLVSITVGMIDRLGRIVSLTDKSRESFVYIAELGREDPHSMVFNKNGEGLSNSRFSKIDLESIIEAKHHDFGRIEVHHDGEKWCFTQVETGEQIDEKRLFAMKMLSLDCASGMELK